MLPNFTIEDARLHFSIITAAESKVHHVMKMDSRISCICFTGLQVQLVCFPSHLLWMDIWTRIEFFQHTKHPNVCFHRLNQNQHSSSSEYIRSPALKMRIIFSNQTILLQFFSPLHSTFLPIFFCSQSSVSLDCIWNYRSSYHSLKRLVCPALCILAVLSNPLVQTPVSLHFPH